MRSPAPLIPVDAKLARDYDVEDEAVALDRIIWALQSVKRLRLILLDACRDNPFVAKLQRSVGVRAAAKSGLANIDDVSTDTLVAYAAKAGSVSYDGDGATARSPPRFSGTSPNPASISGSRWAGSGTKCSS